MRVELQRCNLQGVCGTYLHTHIHTHKLQYTLLFFLSQYDTLFENTVSCRQRIVGILCLFVCCYETRQSLLRFPPWEGSKVQQNAILLFPAFFFVPLLFPPKKVDYKFCYTTVCGAKTFPKGKPRMLN